MKVGRSGARPDESLRNASEMLLKFWFRNTCVDHIA